MKVSLGKVTLIGDGPGVMVQSAPLILGLQSAGYDVRVSGTPSAGIFTTQYGPAMLSGHCAEAWPLSDEAISSSDVVLLSPCSVGWLREICASGEYGRLSCGCGHVLVAPAFLPDDAEKDIMDECVSLCGETGVVVPAMGNRACLGALGELRTASVELCIESVRRALTRQDLAGKRVLITAGPTAEDADPVRYVTNRSTGRMGVALAVVAARRGAEVTVVHGPMSWPLPAYSGIRGVPVRSAQSMYEAVMELIEEQDIAILCAAVADYTPVTYSDIKIKKGHEATFALLLKRTPDILANVGALKRRPYLVGFAAESDHVEANARGKLEGKNCDLLCANDVTEAGSGFAVGTNRVTVFSRSGEVHRLPQMSKEDVSRKILDIVLTGLSERSEACGSA